jgi:beta-galactosidase
MIPRKPYPPLFPAQTGLLHGGDYNPEQWPEEVWEEDAALMKKAHVNSVTVGVFSWVTLEPEEGNFEFGWLDRVMDMQARDGRSVALATPTAAIPAWLSAKYPEVLRTGADRVRMLHRGRVNTCWTSPVYREKSKIIGSKLAERYGHHPALAFWHVSNEYGGECYCKLCEARFRGWLQAKYGSLDALNSAYWSKFWSHTYTDWSQLEIPGEPYGESSVFGLLMDWKRFSSFQIVDFYQHEARTLRSITPDVPCTTNLMGTYPVVNSAELAAHLDFCSWDSYPWFAGTQFDPDAWAQTSFTHDLTRGLKQGRPFLLMESAPSPSNWYSTMSVKRPGVHQLEGLQAIAHGSEGVEYFQWRQSRGGMEQYHGAVVGHNNHEGARVFEEVTSLGNLLGGLDEVVGSYVPAEVALIYDWEVSWAIDTGLGYRSKRPQYAKTVLQHYLPLHAAHFEVDVLDSTRDLSGYKVVIAPMVYMLRPGASERLAKFVEEGGTLVMSYWSGWVNEHSLAYQGGYPEPLRSALGIWCEEMDELYADQSNKVSWLGNEYLATEYCERIHSETAEVVAQYVADFYAGEPAVTKNRYGSGQAYYVASRNEASFTKEFLLRVLHEAGCRPATEAQASEGISISRRLGVDKEFVFVLNYTNSPGTVEFGDTELKDAISGLEIEGTLELPAFGSRVLVRQLAPAAFATR